ncbi:flagellar biosynthesis repressor FlbT [Salipiger bermudensis]|uniref:flagellar biosynthesis repressor FlbT n=1 Tax=Salipiger bermudensis TaxID=344736 RepID=UPI001C99B9C0|nr:flagellar biosynthesis repressor FlbT [Salipiger bermudensis]MBY6006451.1 flagellar biosynthesis repressor FlbT [Salipiger bermudensis]
MALNLTLKPFERFVVNGCMMRNGGRKSTITVETRADIVRETDLLKPDAASTPVRIVYFLIQNALIMPERRDKLVTDIQIRLAELATVFGSELRPHVFEAANNVSRGEYFTALRDLRPLMKREEEVFGALVAKEEENA